MLDGHEVVWRRAIEVATGDSFGAPAVPNRVVVVERRALPGIVSGGDNPGAALRARTVRVYGPSLDNFVSEQELLGHLDPHLVDAHRELAG